MAKEALQHYRLVLVAPRVPGNVGACARLAANFGCTDWVIVAPQCSWEGWDAKKLATGGAEKFLERIRVVATVEEAVRDCVGAVAFTRRSGKTRKTSVTLGEMPGGAPGARVALVFGNEETGLTRDEIEHCSHICSIPTSEAMASMNLSHAVAVVLARVFEREALSEKQRKYSQSGDRAPSAPLGEFEAMLAHWREFLQDAGMTTAGNPDRMLLVLRKLYVRSRITRQEIRALRGVLSKAQVKLGTRVRGRRS